MAKKRKNKASNNELDNKDFYIMLALIAIFGGLLTFQTAEESNFFKPIEAPDGYVTWQNLATTKEIEVCVKTEDMFDDCEIKPEYSKEIIALDGQKIKLMGYMFPLTQGENQKEFLLGPYPQSCPFHYHIGPSQVVEAHSSKGIEFSYEPVEIEGNFTAEYNSEFGVFYYLKDVKIVE